MVETKSHGVEIRDLNLWYGDFQALFDVNLDVRQGIVTSLIGPSGCGKTTLLRMLAGILVPTEKTKTIKGGRQKITETKLYPGYVFVEMQLEPDGRIPQDVFFLVKETTGVGDFVGTAGRPTPMQDHEIEKMLLDSRRPEEEPIVKLTFEKGEPVTIKEGPFQGYEGTVDELLPEKGMVRVLVTIFGRQAPIELEEWQIAKADED